MIVRFLRRLFRPAPLVRVVVILPTGTLPADKDRVIREADEWARGARGVLSLPHGTDYMAIKAD